MRVTLTNFEVSAVTNRKKKTGGENKSRSGKQSSSSPASSTENELEQGNSGKAKKKSAPGNIPKIGKSEIGKSGSGGQLH
jgi:hypothetical protein